MRCKIPSTIFSYISGFMVAVAWFLLIDAQVMNDHVNTNKEMNFLNWLPSIFSFFGWIGLNLVPPENLVPNSDHPHDLRVVWFARIWTFISMFILFGSGVAGLAIMIVDLTNSAKTFVFGKIVTLLHPLLIILSAFVFFIGRIYGDKLKWGYEEESAY